MISPNALVLSCIRSHEEPKPEADKAQVTPLERGEEGKVISMTIQRESQLMDRMELLRLGAATLTIVAAILVALNWSPKLMVAGFVVFIAASLAWLLDGWLEHKSSLVIQNAVLLLVNMVGVYRWLPRI